MSPELLSLIERGAEALLLSRGMSFSSHGAVIAAFGQHFVKTGLLPADHHAALRTAFDQRNVGDYDYDTPFPQHAARDLLNGAEAFVSEVEGYLRRNPESAP